MQHDYRTKPTGPANPAVFQVSSWAHLNSFQAYHALHPAVNGLQATGKRYDNPKAKAKANGEFDCVIGCGGERNSYKRKRSDRPMTLLGRQAEERRMRAIPGADVDAVGFVCPGGFDFKDDAYEPVASADL